MKESPKLDPLAHSPESAAHRIGESTRAVYQHIADGTLRSYKSGKRRRITDAECQRYVAALESKAVAA